MKLNYYPDTDSLYIDFSEQASLKSREVSDGVNVDKHSGARDLSNTAALFQKEVVFLLVLPIIQQLRFALAGEGLEVDHRCGIGGDDVQHLTALHAQESDFGFQYGQWAVKPRGIKLYIEIPHRRSTIRRELTIMAWRPSAKKRFAL